jgi:hypothetical protein
VKAWLAAREAELLPVRYFHLVFTLPKQIADIAHQNKREIYNLLMRVAISNSRLIRFDARSVSDGLRGGAAADLFSCRYKDQGPILISFPATPFKKRAGCLGLRTSVGLCLNKSTHRLYGTLTGS